MLCQTEKIGIIMFWFDELWFISDFLPSQMGGGKETERDREREREGKKSEMSSKIQIFMSGFVLCLGASATL
jgi:hypothetical protein